MKEGSYSPKNMHLGCDRCSFEAYREAFHDKIVRYYHTTPFNFSPVSSSANARQLELEQIALKNLYLPGWTSSVWKARFCTATRPDSCSYSVRRGRSVACHISPKRHAYTCQRWFCKISHDIRDWVISCITQRKRHKNWNSNRSSRLKDDLNIC